MINSMTPDIPAESINTKHTVIFRHEPFIRYELCFDDTLADIARKYHTSVAALCEINNIASPDNIMPGNYILIPTEP